MTGVNGSVRFEECPDRRHRGLQIPWMPPDRGIDTPRPLHADPIGAAGSCWRRGEENLGSLRFDVENAGQDVGGRGFGKESERSNFNR